MAPPPIRCGDVRSWRVPAQPAEATQARINFRTAALVSGCASLKAISQTILWPSSPQAQALPQNDDIRANVAIRNPAPAQDHWRGQGAGDDPAWHDRDRTRRPRVGDLRDQGEQPIRVLLQWRNASSSRYGRGASIVVPALQPFDRCTGADLKMFGSLAPRSTTLNSCDDALTHLGRIRVRHRLASKTESVPIDSPINSPLNPPILPGTFRFCSAETLHKRATRQAHNLH
jgi:hypothetical protein